MELTINEKNVLIAIVANAKSVGDTGIEFLIEDVVREIGKSVRSISATVGSLQKKGAVVCFNGDGYFDGRVTEEGFQAVEIIDNVTQKVESNNKKENRMKEKDFDAPVVDERVVKLNELKSVKLNSLSKKQRLSAKANKYAAQFVSENWDDEEALKKFINDEDEKIHCYEVWCIADSRYKQLTFRETVEDKTEEMGTPEAETEQENTATTSETTAQSSKPTKTVETKTKGKRGAKKAYKVGDVHPDHPNWIYTEYKPGKFDWRINKGMKSQTAPVKKEKKAAVKTENKKTTNKTISVEKFIAALQGKNLSDAQKSHLKLLKKGYRISSDHKFFELGNGGDRKACNWESLEALMKRVGVDEVEGLIK